MVGVSEKVYNAGGDDVTALEDLSSRARRARRFRRHGHRVLTLAVLVACCTRPPAPPSHDLVITHVHYLRGAEITSELYNVAVRGGRISYVGTEPPPAKRTLDGRGLVLAPGFLDTNIPGFVRVGTPSRLKLADGVTSYLSAHGGLPGDSLAHQGHQTILNYATTVGLIGSRDRLGDPTFDLPAALEAGVRAGAYGVSLSPEYAPDDATPERVQAICARMGALSTPVSFHARFSSRDQELEGVEEAFACARRHAPVHVLHITSTGGTWHPREAAAIAARARDLGLTLFFDFYPYTSWSSSIQRARFRGDWLERYGVGWDHVRIAGVAGPVDRARLEELRATGRDSNVIVDSIPQETLDFFAVESDASIGSDTAPTSGSSHPRGAGSFARFIRTYVATGRLPLATALHRFSTAACARFAPFIPSLARRGRIEVGYFADLVLWDPHAIRDNATADQPLEPSSGVVAALVNGVPVIVDGRYVGARRGIGEWMKGRLATLPH